MLVFGGLICFHLHKPPADSPAVKPQPSCFMTLTSNHFVQWRDADRTKKKRKKKVAQKCLDKDSDNQGHDLSLNSLFSMSH